MSTKGHTFREISTYLMQTVEGLKMVDKDKGQLDNISNFVFPRPAIFMSFLRFRWENQTEGIKKGRGIIRFKVAVENYADSYTGSVNRDKALAFFDFNEKVSAALEGLGGTYFGPLTLLADEDDLDHKNVIVTIFDFECTMVDASAGDRKNFVLADPELNIHYTNKKDMPAPPSDQTDTGFIIPEV